MLKIALPANMEDTVMPHFALAERSVQFPHGRDSFGITSKTRDLVVFLRSSDIPIIVEDQFDVGLVGSDNVEETRLKFGLSLAEISHYPYGRSFKFGGSTLDIVAKNSSEISSVKDIKPGELVVTEHPLITRRFLENNGHRVAQLGEGGYGAPRLPHEFRLWCEREGLVGIHTIHGRAGALVNIDAAGLGVLVNESGDTLKENDLKIVANIQRIETVLIADRDSLIDPEKEREIKALKRDLDKAFEAICREHNVPQPPEGQNPSPRERI